MVPKILCTSVHDQTKKSTTNARTLTKDLKAFVEIKALTDDSY